MPQVAFWQDRASNLDNLEDQIHSRQVLTYIKVRVLGHVSALLPCAYASVVCRFVNTDELYFSEFRCISSQILNTLDSSYFPAFASLIQEVQQQAVVANEIIRYLKPLKEYFETLCVESSNKMEFDELANQVFAFTSPFLASCAAGCVR